MKTLTIIGGGLAGLTLGIRLRQRGVPVKVLEAGRYPRHRVCGEFISGRGLRVLRQIGLDEVAGECAQVVSTTAFFDGEKMLMKRELPEPALCVSRFILDAALAARFRALDGELRCDTRGDTNDYRDGTIFATGRRREKGESACRWFGLKVHARNVPLEADLEMHIAPSSYVGLCRLANGNVNVCGLFRRDRGGEMIDPQRTLCGLPGTALFSRLQHADFDQSSLCAIGGLSVTRGRLDHKVCRIGDAITMIPPITGNGMSMAFESAEVASEILVRYARGERDWQKTLNDIHAALKKTFGWRLWSADLLHRALFNGVARQFLLPMFFRSSLAWRSAFFATRADNRRLQTARV